MTVQDDIEFCKKQLAQVSRTFGVSIEALEEPMREHVRVAYLLCRILDTIEDAVDVSLPIREALFDQFNACLGRSEEAAPAFEASAGQLGDQAIADIELCCNASRVFRRYWSFSEEIRACLKGPILEMSDGMRLYVQRFAQDTQHRIHSLHDLEEYCYYVAGTVGNLLTNLFLLECPCASPQREAIESLKRSFGLGLQMVNILKDVGDDIQRGACFLPLDRLQNVDISPQSILEPANRDIVLKVMGEVSARAEAHLENAEQYIRQWPTEAGYSIRVFTIVPLVLAIASLALIRQGGDDVLMKNKNPKVSRDFVASVLSQTGNAAQDNQALTSLIKFARDYGKEF